MTNYFEDHGQVFMIVTPVESLMNSRTIREVVERDDKFVVNMNTGELTIRRKPAPKKEKKVVWWRGKGKGSRQLSTDFDVALVQIADEFTMGNARGRLYIDGQCKYNNDSGARWFEIVDNVRAVYRDCEIGPNHSARGGIR